MTQTASRTWSDVRPAKRSTIPEGLWLRCPSCAQMIYRRQMESNQSVCPECSHHFRISASERIEQLSDQDTFVPMFLGLSPADPLKFRDLKAYPDRLLAEHELKVGPADIVREVGIFAERGDIAEETVRLRSHLEQFDQIMTSGESVGRKLEFVTQEMFRETNTIGSKANDAEIARHVVEIKASIERMREMIQNVE